jgi:hypothetical protein
MKIIRDDVCYVDFESLVRRSLTRYMDYDKKDYSFDDIVTISNPTGYKIIKEREDILNYDDVKDLTDSELNKKIDLIEDDMEPFFIKWNNTPFEERDKLYKEPEYKEHYEKLRDYYFEIINYRANRDLIDDKIDLFLINKEKVKRL